MCVNDDLTMLTPWSAQSKAGAPRAGTPYTPMLTCLKKEMIIKLNIPNQKGGEGRGNGGHARGAPAVNKPLTHEPPHFESCISEVETIPTWNSSFLCAISLS